MDSDELLRRSRTSGATASAAAARGATAVPTRHTVIVTCMDARIDPVTLFGIRPGEVHVLRNAGAVVTDDIVRSITISQRKLGTRSVLLVAHTACGMSTFTDDDFATELALDAGLRPPWRPGAFTDPAASVAKGAARLRRSPFLMSGTSVRGFVVDIATFGLVEIPPATAVSQFDSP